MGGSTGPSFVTDATWVAAFKPASSVGSSSLALSAPNTGKKGARCTCAPKPAP
jgi:hypothetical protein